MSPSVSIVIPVFNEETILAESIERLVGQLGRDFPHRYEIVIANNGSTDGTLGIARSLADRNPNVRVLHLEEKGRGRALKTAWLESSSDILSYMDADLSSDIGAFPALIEPLANGRYDLAIGSRLLDPKLTTRCLKRELASRVYNLLHRTLLHTGFRDAQCGFKAITRQAARPLLPLVEDTNWFFDTELLVLAQRHGCRILELPVRWVENRNTHVKLMATAIEDLQGLWRMRQAVCRGPRTKSAGWSRVGRLTLRSSGKPKARTGESDRNIFRQKNGTGNHGASRPSSQPTSKPGSFLRSGGRSR